MNKTTTALPESTATPNPIGSDAQQAQTRSVFHV